MDQTHFFLFLSTNIFLREVIAVVLQTTLTLRNVAAFGYGILHWPETAIKAMKWSWCYSRVDMSGPGTTRLNHWALGADLQCSGEAQTTAYQQVLDAQSTRRIRRPVLWQATIFQNWPTLMTESPPFYPVEQNPQSGIWGNHWVILQGTDFEQYRPHYPVQKVREGSEHIHRNGG